MAKKLFGIFGLFFFLISALLFALNAEGVPYEVIGRFISLPSFVIVAAFSGLTYAKKDNYRFNELGKVLKEDLILGGWVGTIIGLVITFGGVNKSIIVPTHPPSIKSCFRTFPNSLK